MDRQQMFDSFLLPKLQEEFIIAHSATRTIRTVLVKKGIIHDDPYKYDSKISEIEIPPDDTFTESEKSGIIGRRLSQYESMLDFIHNYYQFTCDFLTTERITKLVAFNRSFSWEAFSNTSSRVNTKGLSDLINTLRNGGDQLSISIINDSLTQLSKSSLAITKTLKHLSDFHRERYKLAVRKLVLPAVNVTAEILSSSPSSAMREIKHSFALNMKDQPFYTELIDEILKEEFSPEKAVLQQELLSRLALNKTDSGKAAAEENFKQLLMDGIRTIGSTGPQLDEIALKLQENQNLILSMEKGFFHKLALMLRKAFNKPEAEQEVTITTVDPVTQTGKRETIKFLPFLEDLKKRSRIYNGFTLRTSASYQRIELMDEKMIFDLLTRHVAELGSLLKTFAGMDDYFKQTIQADMHDRVRGIKIEISTIRNSLVKANQCRAEYASQVEEQQQLKKLGITNV